MVLIPSKEGNQSIKLNIRLLGYEEIRKEIAQTKKSLSFWRGVGVRLLNNNMKKIFFIIISAIAIFTSCNNGDFKTSDKGIEYKFHYQNTEGEKPELGDILVLNMNYTTENDSVIFDTREVSNSFKMKYKLDTYEGGSINDAFSMMHVGDSATFILDAELFYINSKETDPPSFIKSGDKVKFNIKIVEIFSMEKYNKQKLENHITKSKDEIPILESYLRNANIDTEPTSSGLYYIEIEKGTGASPEAGQRLSVNYTGTLISGKVFDSTNFRNKPFEFGYGRNEVIDGWEEALSYMKVGGKAKLIIPSYLAYGEEGYKDIISPYSTLIFDIELLEIKKID